MEPFPRLRIQNLTRDSSFSGFLDLNGEFSTGSSFPTDVFMQPWIANTLKPSQEFSGGDWHEVPNIGHVEFSLAQCNASKCIVNPQKRYSRQKDRAYLEGMDRWPHRAKFASIVREYTERTGATQANIAANLDISLSYLRNLLYVDSRVPSWDLMMKASKFFGVPPSELIDDPVSQLAGHDLAKSSEFARFLSSVIVKDVASPDLTEDDLHEIWEDFKRGMDRIRRRKASSRG